MDTDDDSLHEGPFRVFKLLENKYVVTSMLRLIFFSCLQWFTEEPVEIYRLLMTKICVSVISCLYRPGWKTHHVGMTKLHGLTGLMQASTVPA